MHNCRWFPQLIPTSELPEISASGKVEHKTGRTHEPPEEKRRQFTSSDVLKMTNNFGRILGKGGFGTAYHGYLNDTQAAVRMLSPSSVQGYKEFEAEVIHKYELK